MAKDMINKQAKIPLLKSRVGAPISCKILNIPLIKKLHSASTPEI